MQVVYDLRKDLEQIERIQHATLNTENVGIQKTHGLYGSEEWFDHIADGNLQVHTVTGVITDNYMGSMRDWPMIEVKDESGNLSKWTREVNDQSCDNLYEVGRGIEIDYVVQKHKEPMRKHGPLETKCVTQIRVL